MQESQHTPGPWSVDRTDDYGSYRIHEAAREQNLWVDEGYAISEEEGERRNAIAERHDEGNRRLIQVIPLMREVLKAALACFNGQHNRLSTATDEERKAVVENFLDWWNHKVLPVFDKIGFQEG